MMKQYMNLINDIVGQIYQEECLQHCVDEVIPVHQERMFLLHSIVMNFDCLSLEEILERTYRYGTLIRSDELLARQIFLCLLHLIEIEKRNEKESQ